MEERFQNLTTSQINAVPGHSGFIQVGIVRQIEKHTILYLHADRVNGRYEPSISVFSYGKRIEPMDDPFCFDLVKQARMFVCIRGIKYGVDGRPKSYLVETYHPEKVRLISNFGGEFEPMPDKAIYRKKPILRLIK